MIDSDGDDGSDLGAEVPLPAGLAQPFIVFVAVLVRAVLTVTEGVVSKVLHNNDPV